MDKKKSKKGHGAPAANNRSTDRDKNWRSETSKASPAGWRRSRADPEGRTESAPFERAGASPSMGRPCVYLIHHADTAWTASGQLTVCSDLALTPEGEWESRMLRERLLETDFAHVLTAPRTQARRTCELCGFGSVAQTDPDLAEWDYGEYEGRIIAEILADRPDWNLFRDGCPGGESPTQVTERADRVIARLNRLSGRVALFLHGHFARVLGVRWIGLRVREAGHFNLRPASLSILGFDGDHPGDSALLLWNASAKDALHFPARPTPKQLPPPDSKELQRWEGEGGQG